MDDQQLLDRISVDPSVMAGKPVIRGTRLTVDYILNQFAHGTSADDLLAEHDGLAREDIQACVISGDDR